MGVEPLRLDIEGTYVEVLPSAEFDPMNPDAQTHEAGAVRIRNALHNLNMVIQKPEWDRMTAYVRRERSKL